MKRVIFSAAAIALLIMVSGCGAGIIYTHTYAPLSTDLDRTPLVQGEKTGDIKHIQLGQIGVAWDSVAYGDIARKNGMNVLYFADLETFKILNIWNQYTVHLYGR